MHLAEIAGRVLGRAFDNRLKWRRATDEYWLMRLVEEVGELSSALLERGEDSPDLELAEIASMCINWLHYRATRDVAALQSAGYDETSGDSGEVQTNRNGEE